jgi:redox-sensitive bicupin YhaK (pirin superfamily)
MTAGKGIVHSEMPEQEEGLVHGFQLWLNLPKKDKMCDASYRDVQAEEIPHVALAKGVVVRVLAGTVGGVTGPIAGRDTAPLYFDVSLEAGATADIPVPAGHEGFVYPFEGNVIIGDKRELVRGELGVMTDGDGIRLRADARPARVLVVAGKPLREPVVQYGPFVMTTPEEVEQAVRDFQAGRF